MSAAVFATSAYLSAGPGSLGGLYINEKYSDLSKDGIFGDIIHRKSSEGTQLDPYQLARLVASLELFEEVSFDSVWAAN